MKVPAPAFVSAPAPEITPDRVWLLESPVVSVIPLANSTAPEPLKDWIVSVVSTSYVAEFMTSVLSESVPETVNFPAEIVVSPV